MTHPRLLIASGASSREVRVLSQEAMMLGMLRQAWDPISNIAPAANASDVVPVGSVEFVQAAMSAFGCATPMALGFPAALEPFLFRRIAPCTVGDIKDRQDGAPPVFIKPRDAIKTFTGFVLDAADAPDDFEQEQLDVLARLPHDTPLWVSDVVAWQSEWRYYVTDGEIIGSGRYDPDGADEAPVPNQSILLDAVAAFEATGTAPVSYSLDFGVLGTGETALVEINDGWALGYYTGSLTPALYLKMLSARWREIVQCSAPGHASPFPSP